MKKIYKNWCVHNVIAHPLMMVFGMKSRLSKKIHDSTLPVDLDENKASKFIWRMKGQDYIDKTREYLDYIEDHLINVAKAFSELSDACDGKEHWVGDDCAWHGLKHEIEQHDLSKLTKEEFVQYRDNFFPVCDSDKENSDFGNAWENHKEKNHHHHETAKNYFDLVHMVVDWVAMSYKFKGNPRDFYEKTKPTMNLKPEFHDFISKQFDHLEAYRASRWKRIL